jgi:hypothetical protein
MKTTMIALALFLGFAVGGAALLPSGQAHAVTWCDSNSGCGGGGAG